jgi:hypothetical protein
MSRRMEGTQSAIAGSESIPSLSMGRGTCAEAASGDLRGANVGVLGSSPRASEVPAPPSALINCEPALY